MDFTSLDLGLVFGCPILYVGSVFRSRNLGLGCQVLVLAWTLISLLVLNMVVMVLREQVLNPKSR